MIDLTTFTMGKMTELSIKLRKLGDASHSMEETAQKLVRCFYDNIKDPDSGKNALALVRFFTTFNYHDLSPDLQAFSDTVLSIDPVPQEMKCLTLLASKGDKPEWDSRTHSAGHKAIPLPSEELVRKFPMVSNLVRQFGLDLNDVLHPDPACLRDIEEKSYNVFYVPDALGSSYIPAQEDFVIPHGIKTVMGFGGVLPSANIFAVIMFSKVAISREVADLFKPMTLSVKISLLQHDGVEIFSS